MFVCFTFASCAPGGQQRRYPSPFLLPCCRRCNSIVGIHLPLDLAPSFLPPLFLYTTQPHNPNPFSPTKKPPNFLNKNKPPLLLLLLLLLLELLRLLVSLRVFMSTTPSAGVSTKTLHVTESAPKPQCVCVFFLNNKFVLGAICSTGDQK